MALNLSKTKIKYLTLFILAAFFFVCVQGCGSDENKSSYERGIDSLQSQNYSEALEFFNSAVSEGENLRLALRGRGMAYLGLGEYDKAISAFEDALHESNGIIRPVDYDINLYLATAEYKKGDYEAAKQTYTSIIELKENADAYYLRGRVSLGMGQFDDARADFDKAIALDKDDANLYINIHDDLIEYGYEADAKGYINQAVANINKPSSYELAMFNYYLGDYSQARNYFESSSDTKKTEEGIIYLGKTYEALGDSGYAASLYEAYAAGDNSATEVYNELGRLKFAEKDYEGALKAFETGLENGGGTCRQSLMYNQIITYEFLKDFSKAASLMKTYLTLYPDDELALREDVFLRTR